MDGQAQLVAASLLEPHAETRITIADACQIFITNRESAGLAPATLRKYRTFRNRSPPMPTAKATSCSTSSPLTISIGSGPTGNWGRARRASVSPPYGRSFGFAPPQMDRRIACQPGY